jgi:hypothetical protein
MQSNKGRAKLRRFRLTNLEIAMLRRVLEDTITNGGSVLPTHTKGGVKPARISILEGLGYVTAVEPVRMTPETWPITPTYLWRLTERGAAYLEALDRPESRDHGRETYLEKVCQ